MQKAKPTQIKMKKMLERIQLKSVAADVDAVSLGNAAVGGTFGSQTLGGLYLILNSINVIQMLSAVS